MTAGPPFSAPQPVLRTNRLLLRPFTAADAPLVQRLAGVAEVADTTLTIPYPYPDGEAERWIAAQPAAWARGENAVFAITTPADGLIGAMNLRFEPRHRRGEVGYWIGVPYWNRGFATEALGAVIDFGFDSMDLHRIHAHHLSRNPSSGRVMAKAGMRHEGVLRGHILRGDVFEDVVCHAILRSDRSA